MNNSNIPNPLFSHLLVSNSGDDLDEVTFPHSQLIVKSSDDDEA